MIRYGQTITWGTLGAPHPFHGICTNYSYQMQLTRQLDTDESGDNRVLIQHSRKAAVSFEAKVVVGTGGSTNFLDLSTGAAVLLSASVPGSPPATSLVLATRAVERWSLGQPKTISLQATHYPDMLQASPTMAGTRDVTADDQSSLAAIITPGGKLIYSTAGLSLASPNTGAGIIHSLEISQELQLTEDDPSPVGTIVGAASHGYLRTLQVELLSQDVAPAEGTSLSITGPASQASNYQIESVDIRFQDQRGKMYSISAVWIPPFN